MPDPGLRTRNPLRLRFVRVPAGRRDVQNVTGRGRGDPVESGPLRDSALVGNQSYDEYCAEPGSSVRPSWPRPRLRCNLFKPTWYERFDVDLRGWSRIRASSLASTVGGARRRRSPPFCGRAVGFSRFGLSRDQVVSRVVARSRVSGACGPAAASWSSCPMGPVIGGPCASEPRALRDPVSPRGTPLVRSLGPRRQQVCAPVSGTKSERLLTPVGRRAVLPAGAAPTAYPEDERR